MTVSSLSSEESGTPASACLDFDEQRKWHKWSKTDKSITKKKKKWNSLSYIWKHWICNRIYLYYMLFSAMHWVVYMGLSCLLHGSALCDNLCRIPCNKHVCWSRTGLRRSLVVGSMLFVHWGIKQCYLLLQYKCEARLLQTLILLSVEWYSTRVKLSI